MLRVISFSFAVLMMVTAISTAYAVKPLPQTKSTATTTSIDDKSTATVKPGVSETATEISSEADPVTTAPTTEPTTPTIPPPPSTPTIPPQPASPTSPASGGY